MEKVNHPSVDWSRYFKSIRTECPWSYAAYTQGLIDIVAWSGEPLPLGTFQARVYVCNDKDAVEALSSALDHGESEWLFSYPGYGPWATPVPVLIQQNRHELAQLRKQQSEEE